MCAFAPEDVVWERTWVGSGGGSGGGGGVGVERAKGKAWQDNRIVSILGKAVGPDRTIAVKGVKAADAMNMRLNPGGYR